MSEVLTAKFVSSVSVEKRTEYRDAYERGLVLRVSPDRPTASGKTVKGPRSWYLVYSSPVDQKRRRLKLGNADGAGAVSLEEARKRAALNKAKLFDGNDPALDKAQKKQADTFAELAGQFVEEYARPKKRTWQSDERVLKRDVLPLIGALKVHDVKPSHIRQIRDQKIAAGSPVQSRNVLACVKKLCRWAVSEGLMESNPAADILHKVPPASRDRCLSEADTRMVWARIDDAPLAPESKAILRLLMLTGQRSGEVCGMEGREIDLQRAEWVLPKARTKNGVEHVVPLSDQALAILEPFIAERGQGPLFVVVRDAVEPSAISRAVKRNLDHFGVEEAWRPHDLRRTAATLMAENGVQPHIVEAVLNHISGAKAGIAGRYNKAAYAAEKRAALVMWADRLAGSGKVVPMKRA